MKLNGCEHGWWEDADPYIGLKREKKGGVRRGLGEGAVAGFEYDI